MSQELQVSTKLQVTSFIFTIFKLRVANYKLKLELQFGEKFAESNFETASC